MVARLGWRVSFCKQLLRRLKYIYLYMNVRKKKNAPRGSLSPLLLLEAAPRTSFLENRFFLLERVFGTHTNTRRYFLTSALFFFFPYSYIFLFSALMLSKLQIVRLVSLCSLSSPSPAPPPNLGTASVPHHKLELTRFLGTRILARSWKAQWN